MFKNTLYAGYAESAVIICQVCYWRLFNHIEHWLNHTEYVLFSFLIICRHCEKFIIMILLKQTETRFSVYLREWHQYNVIINLRKHALYILVLITRENVEQKMFYKACNKIKYLNKCIFWKELYISNWFVTASFTT